jgi:MFS family permease
VTPTAQIPRRTVLCLGFSQLIGWGITYYLIGGFGQAIGQDLGWSRDVVYGGFSAGLGVMALTSPLTGRLIDRHGGRGVMVMGSVLSALGCLGIALSHSIASYYGAWICLGLAMRFSLYDAAFASLARLGGAAAKGPISQITLLGGLASTVFWPIGSALAAWLGWRGAIACYAGFALLTIPLHLAIPPARRVDLTSRAPVPANRPLAATPTDRAIAGTLYALIATLTNILNSAMSAHMIGILGGLGIAAGAAVWIATLRGVGQSLARGAEVLFGRRLDPLKLNLCAAIVLPLCFVAGLASGVSAAAALGFAFFYGAANGITTITRGTLPLVLFETSRYGEIVGKLLIPSFILQAGAPVLYAAAIDAFGAAAALWISIGLAGLTFLAALGLVLRFSPRRA